MFEGIGAEWPDLVTAGALGDAQILDAMHELELDRRRRAVEAALLVGQIDQRTLHLADGMRTAKSWCRGIPRWTSAEAAQTLRVARLLRDHAEVLTVEHAIRLPVGHLAEVARAAANPRCGKQISDVMPVLLYWGDQLDHAAFKQVVQHWEQRADADGAGEDQERSHNRRHITLSPGEAGGSVSGWLGSMQHVIVEEVIEQFAKAEWYADWEWVKETYGDQATPDKMPRTAPQRRADAFVKMALRAASMPLDAHAPIPVINLVMPYEDFVNIAGRVARDAGTATATNVSDLDDDAEIDDPDDDLGDEFGDDVLEDGFDDVDGDPDQESDSEVSVEPVESGPDRPCSAGSSGGTEPASARRRRSADDLIRRGCESKSGVSLDPADVFAAAVLGRVRRVVIDSNGVIVDAGHRRRCFTGPMRDVLMVVTGRCDWIGCDVHDRREADHLKPRNHGGATALANAGAPCRWHNNLKNRGFLARRDDNGLWHYHRPDGTEIIPI